MVVDRVSSLGNKMGLVSRLLIVALIAVGGIGHASASQPPVH